MRRREFIAAAGSAVALSACGAGTETAATGGRTRIRFATDWRAQAEHGGFYQALANGLYADKGLDVTIIQGGPGVNVPQLIAAGAVEMGMGSNSFIPLNMVQAKAGVRAVAAFFQKDPQVLLTHPREDVKTLADMKGMPIMLADASITAFWVWLKATYGFTDDQVRKYTFNPAPFLNDPRAIQQGYVTSEPYTLEKAGVKPQIFLLADYGYGSYATMALAPDRMVKDQPDAVRAFVEASAQGWTDYLKADPAKADALIQKDNPDMTPDLLAQAREKLKAFGIVESGDALKAGVGVMTEARWQGFFDTMAKAGVYPADLAWRDAFSLDFVGKPA
jgi:NitT/TauT family transport system substrate-binding protein